MRIYRCQDSLESIFTAIYNAYEDKQKPQDTMLSLTDEPFLFAEEKEVVPDSIKTIKVMRTLHRQFGESDYMSLCYALSSRDCDKAQAVYQTVAWGLRCKTRPGHLLDRLANDDVNRVFKLAKNAGREEEHLRGFLRFEEKENGIMYSKIGPKNNLLTFLMPHFADRFPGENFVIYDDTRGIFGVHPAYKNWYLMQGEDLVSEIEKLCPSENEVRMQQLFTHFCKTITIQERANSKLQQNMLPLRFREYMVEFQ